MSVRSTTDVLEQCRIVDVSHISLAEVHPACEGGG
jgi:hypothetical protein